MNDIIPAYFSCFRDEESNDMRFETRMHRRTLDAMGIRHKSLYVGCDVSCWLNLSGTIIADLSPLKQVPVTHLCLQGCFWITDFSPLSEMKLKWLNLSRTRITDLSPLSELPLAYLKLYSTRTTSLSPLKEIPLKSLDIRFTKITDLSPLRSVPLRELSFFPGRIKKGFHVLRGMETLTTINRRTARNTRNCV